MSIIFLPNRLLFKYIFIIFINKTSTTLRIPHQGILFTNHLFLLTLKMQPYEKKFLKVACMVP